MTRTGILMALIWLMCMAPIGYGLAIAGDRDARVFWHAVGAL